MANDPTIVRQKELVINRLSEEQYQQIPIPSDQEIYLTPDTTEEELEGKVDKTDQASKIYGTDSNGDQVLYDANNFENQVTDVKVNNVSVVNNKIANIDLTGKVDKVTTASRIYGTDSTGAQTTYDRSEFQDKLVAGNNITIDANNRIDAEDKTLVSFVIWEDEE